MLRSRAREHKRASLVAASPIGISSALASTSLGSDTGSDFDITTAPPVTAASITIQTPPSMKSTPVSKWNLIRFDGDG